MDEQELAQILDQFADEDIEVLLNFVDQVGGFDDANAAVDALDQLRKAA